MTTRDADDLGTAREMLGQASRLLAADPEPGTLLAEEKKDIAGRIDRLAVVLQNASLPHAFAKTGAVTAARQLTLEAEILREEALDLRARIGTHG